MQPFLIPCFEVEQDLAIRGLQENFFSFHIGESSETQTLAQSLLLQLSYVDANGRNGMCCLSIEIT